MYTGGPLGRSVEGTTIHLVCPDQPDQLRDGAGRWMDELRALLFQTDSRLVLHQGPQFRQADPGPVLESLTRQNPDSCWILARTSVQIQRWFEKHKESCLVAGYTHPGIQLPSVFIDLETACRDAVRVLRNSGHNEVGFIQQRPERARDLRSTFGFEAGLKSETVQGRIVHHDGTIDSLIAATRDLVESDRPATGILVDSAISYATVFTFLMRAGKRIPEDNALISRTHEPFLDALLPSPSCYQYDLQRFGRLVHAGLLDLLAGKEEITRSLVPTYKPGQSIQGR
jgi:LacI family transcriptional regulator